MNINIEVLNEKPSLNDPFIINGDYNEPIRTDNLTIEYFGSAQEYVHMPGEYVVTAKSGRFIPLKFCWKIKIN